MKILLLFILSTACLAKSIEISSQPKEAEVYLVKNGQKTAMGKTPFLAAVLDLENAHFMIEKKGYSPVYLVIGEDSKERNFYQVTLPPLIDYVAPIQADIIKNRSDELIGSILYTQLLIDKNDHDQADRLLNKLEREYENSIAVKMLRANYQFKKGAFRDSIALYKQLSVSLKPEQENLKTLIDTFLKQVEGKL